MLGSFGDRLLSVLDRRGMTRADLCKKTGLKSAHLVRYVKNPESSPNLSTAIKIADALNVSLDYLAGRDGYDEHGRIGSGNALQPEEVQLVECYRAATPRERTALMVTAETFRDGGSAKNGQVPDEVAKGA